MRDEFTIIRQGKQFVLYAGLLDEAHSKGITSLDTELLQPPSEANGQCAIVKASVRMQDGGVFTGLGDASPENVGRTIAPHIVRMAETRAKARALRDAVNVAAMAFEELSEGAGEQQHNARDAAIAPGGGRGRSSPGRTSARRSADGSRPTSITEAPSNPSSTKARKSQVDLLKTLAVEMRGEDGVRKMEEHIGKTLSDLTHEDANAWIDKLSPAVEYQG